MKENTIEITRDELEMLKKKAKLNNVSLGHADTWPGSEAPGTGTGAKVTLTLEQYNKYKDIAK